MRFRSILVPIALGLLFLLLALFGGPENRWDVALVHAFARERAEHIGSTSAAVALTQFGSVYGTMGAGALACLWLWFHGEKGRTALLAAGVIGERIVMDGMKLIIGRPRPGFDLHPVATHSSSYPSGHSANSMAAFLLIALIAVPKRWRAPAVIVAATLSAAISITRPYLGVHWPSDVLGGWTLALLFVWVVLRVGERRGLLPAEEQHQIVGGHRAALDKR